MNQAEVFNFMPEIAVSFDDLDARDENNNPVKTYAAKQQLQEIFQAGLYNLLLFSELRAVAETLNLIRIKLNLSALAFARQVYNFAGKIAFTFIPSKKTQWHKILACISGVVLALKIFISFLSLSTLQVTLLHKKLAPIVMRL
jgi:hypothetical protein